MRRRTRRRRRRAAAAETKFICVAASERKARAKIFEFLRYFAGRPVETFSDHLLFGQLEMIVLFAEIAIDNVLKNTTTVRVTASSSSQFSLYFLSSRLTFSHEYNKHPLSARSIGVLRDACKCDNARPRNSHSPHSAHAFTLTGW